MRNSKWAILMTIPLLIFGLVLSGCADPSGTISTTSSTPSPTTTPTMTSTTTPTTTSNPIVSVALDYFGIRNTHWVNQFGGDSTAQIQFIVVLSDATGTLATWPPDPTSQTFDMNFFQVIPLQGKMGGNTTIYSGPVSGTLSLRVVANNVNKGAITKAQIDAIKSLGGGDLSALKAMIPDKELVGNYWNTWARSNNQYSNGQFSNSADNTDLIVWGRIGSPGQMSGSITQPVLVPNIKIGSLTLPTNAKVSSLIPFLYTTTLRLVNTESVDLTVNWQAHSSVTGDFDNGAVTVPKNGYVDVSKSYGYIKPGSVTVTYTMSYAGAILDTKSGTMTVAP